MDKEDRGVMYPGGEERSGERESETAAYGWSSLKIMLVPVFSYSEMKS